MAMARALGDVTDAVNNAGLQAQQQCCAGERPPLHHPDCPSCAHQHAKHLLQVCSRRCHIFTACRVLKVNQGFCF